MLESERQKLLNHSGEYLSIGITDTGEPITVISVPWEMTAHAFNMKMPHVYITPEDLNDTQILEDIARHTVIGCYIFTPLKDYSFLSRFNEIRDLSISYGDNVHDLDFLKGLSDCRMVYIENAKLKDLDTLVKTKKESNSLFGCFSCVGLYNCTVEDLSIFEREKIHFSEFLVWNYNENSKDSQDRYKHVSANTRKYFCE